MTTIATRMPDGYDCRRDELPELNVPLLYDLLKWAEGDEELAAKFRHWGAWDQGVWARIDLNEMRDMDLDARDPEAIEVTRRNGVCQTAYCMAGQAVAQSDYRLIMDDGSATDCIKERPTDQKNARGFTIWEDVPNAPQREIWSVAQEILGLTYVEQSQFFQGDNQLGRLRELANLFTDVRGLPLLFPDDRIANLYRDEDDEDDGDF